jgi:hypothetical protein
MIVFSLTILRASLYAERTSFAWALVAAFSMLSVALNVIHAPSNIVAWVVAGVSPVALLLSFESLMSQVRTSVKRRSLSQSLGAMTEAVSRARAELAALERQADEHDKAVSQEAAESLLPNLAKAILPHPGAPGASPPGRAAFIVAYRANGHKSVAVLAQEIGVNVRTAQRWVRAESAG